MSKSILDAYIKKRQNGSAVYNPRQTQYGQGIGYQQTTPKWTPMPADKNGQVPVYRPNQWSRPAMMKAPATAQQMTPTIDATQPTDSLGSNVLTWDDQIDIEIQNAAKKVLEVSNRKFQYNSYESPIYSIMRQEYLKEADLAAGRATAAAAQNAGGFGSSFAVMAGEEARRQVMEGFYDQEAEMYAAAQSEFEAEKASAFDNYLNLRKLKAMEQERLATEVPTTMTLDDGTTVEVTEEARKLYEGYLDSFMEGTGYDTLKTAMINGGAREADADQAIAMFKRLGSDTISDQISALGTSPTLSGAAKIMAQAKVNGTEAEVLPEVSAAVGKGFEAAMQNPNNAYEFVGVSKEKWEELAESNRSAMILEYAAQAYSEGMLTRDGMTSVIMQDVQNSLFDIHYVKDITTDQSRDVLTIVEGVMGMAENGMIDTAMENEIVDKIAKTKVGKAAYDYLTEKDRKRKSQKYSGMFKDVLLPGTGLDQSQSEALALLGKSVSRLEGQYDKADAVYDKIASRYK